MFFYSVLTNFNENTQPDKSSGFQLLAAVLLRSNGEQINVYMHMPLSSTVILGASCEGNQTAYCHIYD